MAYLWEGAKLNHNSKLSHLAVCLWVLIMLKSFEDITEGALVWAIRQNEFVNLCWETQGFSVSQQ